MAEYGLPTIWSVYPQELRTFSQGMVLQCLHLDHGVVGHLIGHIEDTAGESRILPDTCGNV